MVKNIFKYLYKQISLFVIVFGAICFFLSNIFMKEVLPPYFYGQYSIVVTFFSLLYSFGIFGTEQVFIRFSNRIETNLIETQKTQIVLITALVIFSSLLSTFFFKTYYSSIKVNTCLLFISSFSMIGIMFLFTILRINSNFFISQLIANFWKIVLFFISSIYIVSNKSDLEFFVNFLCISLIVVFLGTLIIVQNKVKFKYNKMISDRDIFIAAFHFFVSILSFTLIIFSDRFIIESKFKLEEFGNFFYLINFFLAPFSILQNYIGFKQLIIFKDIFNKECFIKSNQKSIVLGVLLSLFLLFAAYIITYYHIFSFDFQLYRNSIFLLLLTGIIRLYSSSVSAAFEARTSIKTLQKSNVYIVIITSFGLLLTYYFANSIEIVLIFILLLWCSRCLVHRQFLLFQIKNENNETNII
jgi:O-antigen/teichoic acid export membrane protein